MLTMNHRFQFLIGTVLPVMSLLVYTSQEYVSIPYRYGITNRVNTLIEKSKKAFQFLIGTVLQQCFRCFPALSSFFVSNLFKKSVDLTFLLSQISLKNQVFYKN